MAKFDADIGWTTTHSMATCECGHFEKAHRPISRRCSLCRCVKFLDMAEKLREGAHHKTGDYNPKK